MQTVAIVYSCNYYRDFNTGGFLWIILNDIQFRIKGKLTTYLETDKSYFRLTPFDILLMYIFLQLVLFKTFLQVVSIQVGIPA